jgi:uracil-DNA glycosylase family protein
MPRATRPPSPVRELIPQRPTIGGLRRIAADCHGCELYKDATQTVFGKGSADAEVMFVGEQPGDQEDRRGEPFVGPAGRLLDRALAEAGIARDDVYVTNVVKHFHFQLRGRMRLHKTPEPEHIHACMPWVEAELTVVRPTVLVCLGATAAQAMLGSWFRVTRHRGDWVDSDLAPYVMGTIHPSAILRAPDEDAKQQGFDGLVLDLAKVHDALAAGPDRRAGGAAGRGADQPAGSDEGGEPSAPEGGRLF